VRIGKSSSLVTEQLRHMYNYIQPYIHIHVYIYIHNYIYIDTTNDRSISILYIELHIYMYKQVG
jgi:hypothetical protein